MREILILKELRFFNRKSCPGSGSVHVCGLIVSPVDPVGEGEVDGMDGRKGLEPNPFRIQGLPWWWDTGSRRVIYI